MNMKNKLIILTGFLILVLTAPAWAADPLPSWNKGASKSAIIEFVQAVTDKSSPKYTEPDSPHRERRRRSVSDTYPDKSKVFSNPECQKASEQAHHGSW